MKSLKAGAAKIDITPPLDIGILMSSVEKKWSPFLSVRKPLLCRVLVLADGDSTVALISLDLLGLTDTAVDGWPDFKRDLGEVSDHINIIVHCTHTHSAPESLALTDLYKSPGFRQWIKHVGLQVNQCIKQALSGMQECHATYGSGILEHFSLQRRVATENGMQVSHTLQPIAEALFKRTPVDRRIRVLRFIAANTHSVISSIVHMACHPVHEMCIPLVSPDYPGILCEILETEAMYGMPLFLNGAAADINPPTVSCGAEFSEAHARAITATVSGISASAISTVPFRHIRREVQLYPRLFPDAPPVTDCIARVNIICMGNLSIVFLPGEPFVQTGLDIEMFSSFKETMVTGYSENSIGYIPPKSVFEEGGYETGPGRWSYLDTGAEFLLKQVALGMLTNAMSESETDI